MRLALETAGYDGTFTIVADYRECKVQQKKLGIWITIGTISAVKTMHAITDVHFADGSTAWIDPTIGPDPVDISGEDNKVNTLDKNTFKKGSQSGNPGLSINIGKLPKNSYEPYIEPESEDPEYTADGKTRVICTEKGKAYMVFDDRESAKALIGPSAFPESVPADQL